MVTNGDFATDSDWILTTGSNISDGKLNAFESAYTFFARQLNVVTIGKQYKVTFDVDIQGGNGVLVYLSDSNAFGIIQTSGTHTFYLTADGSQIRFRAYDQGFIGSIDNVSVKEVTTATNTPRIDYSTGEKAFLLEPQSTNITPYSEDFTQSWTPTGLTITSNSIASPSGEINSDKWVEDTSNGAHSIRNNPNIPVTSGNNYTMSIFAKAGERTGLRFANAAESNAEGRFDLSNGTVTFAGTNTTFVGIEDYGNGWYRCIISFTASTTIAQLNLRLMDGSSLSYQGDGTSGLYAWGAQLEQQSYATSYIPTSGASATRNQELCNNATPVINSEEGTLYAEISALA